MKGFRLDSNGDIVVNADIDMVYDNELIRQTIETVLKTKCGEWFLNAEEGLQYDQILIKNPNFDFIRTEIQKGLLQVDESLWITEYDQVLEGRKLTITFTAKNDADETIRIEYTF